MWRLPKKKENGWVAVIIVLLFSVGLILVVEAVTFLDLTDTPNTYNSYYHYPVSINNNGSALVFNSTFRAEGIQSIFENRSNITFTKYGDVIITIDPIELDNQYTFAPTISRSTTSNGWRITGQDSYCSGRTCSDYYEVCELTGVKRDFPVVYFVDILKPKAMYEWKDVIYERAVWIPDTYVDENGTTKYSSTGSYAIEEYTIPQWKKLAGYLISEGTAVGNTLEGTINIGKNDCKQFRFDTPAVLGDSYKAGLTWLDPLINNTWYFIGNSTNTSNLWNVDMNASETTLSLTNSNKTLELGTTSTSSALVDNNTLYWTLDDADLTGDNPDDVTGNGWDGTSFNTPTTSVASVINEGFRMDAGTNERVRVDGVNHTNADKWAFSMWYKCDIAGGGCGASKNILGSRRDDTSAGTILLIQPNYNVNNEMFLRVRDDSGNQLAPDWYSTAQDTQTDNWKHFVLTANATHVSLYLNGTLDSTRTNTFGGNVTMDFGQICLNCDPYLAADRQENDAYYDEFSFWANRSLTSKDVQELYNAGAGFQYPYGSTTYNVSANKYVSLPIPLNNKTQNITTYFNYTGNNMNATVYITCDYYNTTPTYYTLTSSGETRSCPNTNGTIQYNITLDGTSTNTPVFQWLNISTLLTPLPVDHSYNPMFIVQDEQQIRLFNVSKVTGDAQVRGDLTASNLYVNETLWEDLRFPALDLTLSAVNDPTCQAFNTDFRACSFSSGAINQLFGSFQLPHNWREGSVLKPHFHWSPDSNNAGVVTWCLDYSCADIGDTFPSKSTLCINDEASGTAFDHQMTSMMNLTNTLTASSMCSTRIYRNGTGSADTYGSGAFLLEFDVHYQVYRLGEAFG